PNNIYEALRTEEVTLDGKLASLRGREAALTHLLRQRGAEVVELPSDQTELTRLLRHLRVQEQIYTVFLQRQYEMELESKLRQPKVAEVSREPVVPIVPFSPNRKLYAVIGLGAGILLGLIIAGLVDQLDDTFGDALEIERYVQAPSLGAVPIAPDALLPLPVIAAPTSRFSEAIRAAVVAMQAIWGESAPHRLLVITSPQGNEGVSLVTANVAAAFAETGRSVILVDGNMRQPSLHAAFGVSRESGLADAMSAGGAVAEYLRPTTMPGLRLLTAGTETPNPGALLGSERAKQTWEELRSLADLVIIDTPPVAGLPDVAMIASVADAAVLVLEHSSKRHATQEAAILLRRAGTRVLGCVRNRARGPRETVTIEMPTAA
ncbi:MAG: tyrosine-protein kinase family protein, partial [Candidatus Zipacnadales bacterium]